LRCSTCSNPRVAEVNTLLQANAPVRHVARLTGIPRSNLARHAAHIAPASRPFGVIRGRHDPDGPADGPADPLAEAFKLAEQARTPRERLRALEQVRSSVKLKLRGVRDLDRDDRDLLDAGVAQAMAAFKAAPDFETAARGLSGLREAIAHRLDAVEGADALQTRLAVTRWPGSEPGEGVPLAMSSSSYWAQVPARFRDPDRYLVERVVKLSFAVVGRGEPADIAVKVREAATGALVWTNERPTPAIGGPT
jgi:hypothetical protein